MSDDDLALRLEMAIKSNTKPQKILYDFLSGNGLSSSYVRGKIEENPRILRMITSQAGRAWIKNNIDGFLDYLAFYLRQMETH